MARDLIIKDINGIWISVRIGQRSFIGRDAAELQKALSGKAPAGALQMIALNQVQTAAAERAGKVGPTILQGPIGYDMQDRRKEPFIDPKDGPVYKGRIG